MCAFVSTRRCFVTAWRVSGVPSVSWEIEHGCPSLSFATSASLVSSPNAAKIGAQARRPAAPLRAAGDMVGDVPGLLFPAAAVHAQRFHAAMGRNVVEARLGDDEQRAVRERRQAELDQRRLLLRIVRLRIDRVWVPGKGEERLGLDRLDGGTPL